MLTNIMFFLSRRRRRYYWFGPRLGYKVPGPATVYQ